MQRILLQIFLLLYAFSCPWLTSAHGQENSDTASTEIAALPSEESPSAPQEEEAPTPEVSLPQLIQDKWAKIFDAVEAKDLRLVNDLLFEMDRLKLETGFDSLEQYSVFFIDKAFESWRAHDVEETAFYTRKAIQLSPNSPRVLIKSLPLVKVTGIASVPQQLFKALRGAARNPDILFELMHDLTYPILWALTFGLYLSYFMFFAFRMHDLLRIISGSFPLYLRGITGPLFLLIFLSAPCFMGPLWCIFLWSLFLYMLMPQKRWLVFFSGITLILWGVCIPVRENLGEWLRDDRIQTMLKVSSGIFANSDRSRLQSLVESRPRDGAALYIYGQLLRREGAFEEAEKTFAKAELQLGKQPWTKAERGSLAFLSGKVEEADTLYQEAEQLGLRSPQFYFNYSKIRFELVDPAKSKEYFARANKKDHDTVALLEQREELLGIKSNLALAEMRLPFRILVASMLASMSVPRESYDKFANSLMSHATPLVMVVSGIVLLIVFFVRREKRKRARLSIYYSSYTPPRLLTDFLRVIPGGAWAMAGRPAWCFGFVSVFVFLIMPLIKWPSESTSLLELFPALYPYYLGFVALCWLVVSYIGSYADEEV